MPKITAEDQRHLYDSLLVFHTLLYLSNTLLYYVVLYFILQTILALHASIYYSHANCMWLSCALEFINCSLTDCNNLSILALYLGGYIYTPTASSWICMQHHHSYCFNPCYFIFLLSNLPLLTWYQSSLMLPWLLQWQFPQSQI